MNTAFTEAVCEVGDHFETAADLASEQLLLPAAGWALLGEIYALEDSRGNPLSFEVDRRHQRLTVTGLRTLLPEHSGTARLECLEPGRFLLSDVPPVEVHDFAPFSTSQGVEIRLNPRDAELLREGPPRATGLDAFQLTLRAARLATHAGFDQLMCLPLVRDMELLEHQLRTVTTVLRRMRGRAMLCDEVGLGKTVEAGLTLSELHARGLVRNVLVLTPPSLVEQWQGELRRKFSLDCSTYDDREFRKLGADAWQVVDRVIVSIHTAKRDPHKKAILDRRWDMVIVDEAHHLRNRNTQVWKFVGQLQKQFILLLTATPVQNNLDELFNLVTLLEPGLLSTAKQFQKRFVDRNDKLTPKNVDQLHELLAEVMVRNRRSTVGLQFTRRWAKTLAVTLGDDERQLYDDATRFVRQRLDAGPVSNPGAATERHSHASRGMNRMVLLTLQMTLGSSAAAAASTLGRLSEQTRISSEDRQQLASLASQASRVSRGAKTQRLLSLLDEFREKMVIFTQFRATQQMLYDQLTEAGYEVASFHGGLSRMEKEAAIEQFRGPAQLLLCSEAGSEGRNLQFAHAVCNYDLPWNPMKIEQRIGRLSRIGQTHDVHVFNLVAAGTVEAAVLHLLDAKLSMFEMVIGEIDMVLGNLDDDREFPEVVADVWRGSSDDDDFALRMEDLGNRLLAAKQAYLQQRSHDDRLFGNKFAPEK